VKLTEAGIQNALRDALAATGASSDGYAEIEINSETAPKCAAVLIPLVCPGGDWQILFTRRTQHVESHKGQVSFLGGRRNKQKKGPVETALRETLEEIGVEPGAIRVLGRLTNMITVTGFRVTPIVGILPWPSVFRLNEQEVERIFTIPLTWLANPGNRWELPFPGTERQVVIFHPYDGELVWGATARMTLDFLQIVGTQAPRSAADQP